MTDCRFHRIKDQGLALWAVNLTTTCRVVKSDPPLWAWLSSQRLLVVFLSSSQIILGLHLSKQATTTTTLHIPPFHRSQLFDYI
jgi:hypothetical protein